MANRPLLTVDVLDSGCTGGLAAAAPQGQIPDYYLQIPTPQRDASGRIMYREAASDPRPDNLANQRFLGTAYLDSSFRDGVVLTTPPPPIASRFGCVYTRGASKALLNPPPKFVNEDASNCNFFAGEYLGCPNKRCGNVRSVEGFQTGHLSPCHHSPNAPRCRGPYYCNKVALRSGNATYDNSIMPKCARRCGGVFLTKYKPPQPNLGSPPPKFTRKSCCGCACGPPVNFAGYGPQAVYGWNYYNGYQPPLLTNKRSGCGIQAVEGFTGSGTAVGQFARGDLREEGGPFNITDTTQTVDGETLVHKPHYLSDLYNYSAA